MQNNEYLNIPKEKFEFAQRDGAIHDRKLETKPIGYFKDAWIRFRRNKGSVIAACIILVLVIYAIVIPMVSPYTVTDRDGYYSRALPRLPLVAPLGIWDGCTSMATGKTQYQFYQAIEIESGVDVVSDPKISVNADGSELYEYKLNSYSKVGFIYLNLTPDEYTSLLQYQDENQVQVIFPLTETYKINYTNGNSNGGANFWYELKKPKDKGSTGEPKLDKDGNFVNNYKTSTDKEYGDYTSSMRLENDIGEKGKWFTYAQKNQSGYKVRVLYSEYYEYLNGHEANFIFGANDYGQDIFVSLAAGARLSFLLAVFVSAINLTIGAVYGSIQGYYGGTTDIVMDRITDILSSVPFIVVVTLFKLHFAEEVGMLPSLLFAYVMTGWVGMAALTRKQFYRFKGQEYILAARTLGAKDGRLMFKHIFPNSIGTIITSSVLVIPGVIFSESTLSYLGIINLETSSLTSVGTLLSQGQGFLNTYPHIILFPALFISLLEISFNLFGNGLRDAFNPSLRGVEE